jgi:hypothetical protein
MEMMRSQEGTQSLGWWFLGFSDKEKLLGGCFVEARGHRTALDESHRRKINPGGQVLHVPIPPEIIETIPKNARNRLLTKAELDAIMSE